MVKQDRNGPVKGELVHSKVKWFSQKWNDLVGGGSDVTDIEFGAKLAESVTGHAKTVAQVDCPL